MATSAHPRNGSDGDALDHRRWVDHTRVSIAAPSILGLMIAGAWGRTVLSLGEPGVRQGQ